MSDEQVDRVRFSGAGLKELYMNDNKDILDRRIDQLQKNFDQKTKELIKECDNIICQIQKKKEKKTLFEKITSYFN